MQRLLSRQDDPLYSGDVTLHQWESATQSANAALRETGARSASAGYDRALSIARRLVAAPPAEREPDCVAALVVSHHNLADLELGRGDLAAAVRHLCDAHETLLALAADVAQPASLRGAALRDTRQTRMALLSHVSRHGPHPRITQALGASCPNPASGNPTHH